MRRFFKDARGAVTVLVTLLLVPAILVSGTAVDLARIHAARSILQDANQLAANSVLTQYNALLYDVYGLMGVAEEDPILGALLDEYIRVSVFGEEKQDRALGTLQIFYGSELSVEEVDFAENKNLRDTDVLRRQIEEYMKFRGPILVVKHFLEVFKENKLKEDAETIKKKLEIDSGMEGLCDKYKELYDAIMYANSLLSFGSDFPGGTVGTVSSRLTDLSNEFGKLKACYASWENLTARLDDLSADPDASAETIAALETDKRDAEAHYNALLDNFRVLMVGGRTGSIWRSGSWASYGTTQGLHTTVANAVKFADDRGKPRFDKVLALAREIDSMNAELTKKVDELEDRLNNGECSDELKSGFTESNGDISRSIIEQYREILKWDDITSMADVFKNGGYDYIDNKMKPLLEGVKFRDSANESAGSLTRTQMEALASNPGFALSSSTTAGSSAAGYYAGIKKDNYTYKAPPGFVAFKDHPGQNGPFFEALEKMINLPPLGPVKMYDGQEDEPGEDAEKQQKNIIKALLDFINTAYTGLANNPMGAKYILDDETAPLERLGLLDIAKLIRDTISDSVIGVITDPLGNVGRAGDYLLLLTYSTSMFSHYATARPEIIEKKKDEITEDDYTKTISNIPISPAVNYFYQSEWEYLYSGHRSAGQNLSAITQLLFLIRLVCNYITVFTVAEVTEIVAGIQVSFAWNPPLGLVLGELARGAFAAAEALVDVGALRTGHKVPFIKSAKKDEWVCSPSGVIDAIKDIMTEKTDEEKAKELKEEKGLSYDNYMLMFFLKEAILNPRAAETMAVRTGDLIEWNIINYQSGANADEKKMAEALASGDRFKLEKMKTDFNITTTANMKMLFLSMPIASRGIGPVIPPSVFPLTVTDYRGY